MEGGGISDLSAVDFRWGTAPVDLRLAAIRLCGDGLFLYHETRMDAVTDISEDGILPTSYGQSLVGDMGEVLSPDLLDEEELEDIPEEDLVPRTYVSLKEPAFLHYGDVLLRFPRDSVGELERDVDWYTREEVPPDRVEARMEDGRWIPVRERAQGS